MTRKLAYVVLLCATLVSLSAAQTTSVTIQVTDTDGQSWNSGSFTAQLVMPTGQQPQSFVIAGTSSVVPNQFQSAGLNGTGSGSLIVTPNASIAPSGSQWSFNFCPLATPATCFQQFFTISGTSQALTPTPPGIRVSVSTPVIRALAYLDLEIVGANLGSTYFNITDTTMHLCSTFISNTCTWTIGSGTNVVIGGDLFALSGTQQEVVGLINHALPGLSSGFLQWNGSAWVFSTPGGVISGLTTGFLPKATSSTTIGNSLFDDSVTTANTATYTGTSGLAIPNGPISVGTPPTACGSAPDCIAFGQTSTIGTPTAGQNYLRATSTGWVCSIGTNSEVSCLSGAVTGATTNGGLTLTGLTLGLRTDCSDQQVLKWTLGSTTWGCGSLLSQGSGGLPSTPQIGDVVRYNVNGDSVWDSAIAIGKFQMVSYDITVGLFQTGLGSQTPTTLGTSAIIDATATDGAGNARSATAVASTSTVIGANSGFNGANFANIPIGTFYRAKLRFAAGNTTAVRYWLGLTVFDTGVGGSTGSGVLGSTSMAADAPTRPVIGFRFSAGTDTHWTAVANLQAGTQTVVDTGVTVDTNPHSFEMTTTGTVVTYFIDGAQVAQISTNVPPATVAAHHNSGYLFWCGDNENTATAISGTLYYMVIALK